jgi:pyrroline-5-carboxylate reductase
MKKSLKIGIIGCGNMGSAIAREISPIAELFIFDKDSQKTKNIPNSSIAAGLLDLINNVEVVILAVKPQDFTAVLNEIKAYAAGKLIISIAAGISTKHIEETLGKARVIRVMPNLLIRIKKGLSALAKGKFAEKKDLDFTRKIFNRLGKTFVLRESLMDADTAFLGSGPGFHYELLSSIKKRNWYSFTKNEFIPKYAVCGEKLGFSKLQARRLAGLMAQGDLLLLEKTKASPQTLCAQVTSKGGTTEAGLKVLRQNIKFLPQAVSAACKRAKELSNEIVPPFHT